jgi:hypothetical protein
MVYTNRPAGNISRRTQIGQVGARAEAPERRGGLVARQLETADRRERLGSKSTENKKEARRTGECFFIVVKNPLFENFRVPF